MDIELANLQTKTKKELIDMILGGAPDTKPKAKAPYSRTLANCMQPCKSEKSPKTSEFEAKNAVKVRTAADSSKGEGIKKPRTSVNPKPKAS